jgi:AraC family transcriptional regulator
MISQVSGPIKVRYGGMRKPFFDFPTGPQLLLPWDTPYGAWQGAQRGIHLFIDQDAVERLTHKAFRRDSFERKNGLDPIIHHLMSAMHMDVASGHQSGPLLGETIVTALLLRLIADTPVKYGSHPRTAGSQREFGKYREWIDAHLAKPFSLEDLAADMGVSVRQLHREVLRATGMSPYRYILMQRTERARQLIIAGQLSLSEVALAVGFYDQAHMSHTFRKLLGAPPSHFSNTTK